MVGRDHPDRRGRLPRRLGAARLDSHLELTTAGTSRELAAARSLIDSARRIVVLTGAGISAESGVPTFRGPDGLWKRHRPEELATPGAFQRDPRLVWEWYAWRRGLVAACEPNPAHHALARAALALGATIVTQNVDGLHHRAADAEAAGGDGDAGRAYPLEVHGAIHRDRCSSCGLTSRGRDDVDTTSVDALPRCDCGGLLRPDVVWFGEALDADVLGSAFDAARSADVCLVIGTSAVVHPAAAIPEITLRSGGRIVEVNPEPTALTPAAAISLRGTAGALVPALLAAPA